MLWWRRLLTNSLFIVDDSNRVKLWPYPDQKGSDYINASFIDVSRQENSNTSCLFTVPYNVSLVKT